MTDRRVGAAGLGYTRPTMTRALGRPALLLALLLAPGAAVLAESPLPAPVDLVAGAVAAPLGCGGAARPAPRARPGRVLRGKATYYSDRLAGRSTASGESYDPRAMTAAHRSLPFGTRVRVRNLRNDRIVEVLITDRGPFGNRERIIDLSRAAAERLQMIRSGVVPVEVEVLSVPGRD